jgi:hypothetical protein
MLFIGVAVVGSLLGYHRLVSIHRPLGIIILVLVLIRFVNRQLNIPAVLYVHGSSQRGAVPHAGRSRWVAGTDGTLEGSTSRCRRRVRFVHTGLSRARALWEFFNAFRHAGFRGMWRPTREPRSAANPYRELKVMFTGIIPKFEAKVKLGASGAKKGPGGCGG